MPKDLRLDLTRAIAIIMVAIVHSMGLINSATETKSILLTKGFYSITQTGVPLFVMLSGALLLRPSESLFHFFKKRLNRVLIPFIVWSVIVSLIHFFQNGGQDILSWPFTFVNDLFGEGVHRIYWYIYMILGLYLLTPILRNFVKDQKLLIYSIILIFSLYYLQYIFPKFSLVNRFYCENILFIGYFLAGYFLYSTPITLVQKIFKYSFFPLYFLTILLSVFQVKFPLIPLTSMSLFTLLLSFKSLKSVSTPISALAKYSYGIYLSHFILISVILKFSFIYKIPLFFEPIVMVTCVIIIDIALLWFIQKIKLSRFFM